MREVYDFIIVGSGSAGGVLANRLSAEGSTSVLVLEAGGMDSSLLMQMPLAAGKMFYNPAFNWPLTTEPEPHADDREIILAAGKVLGGSSSINGMMYTRGHPRDYDQWAQVGCPGWSHSEVLPYFLQAERNWRGKSESHGGDGPLTVSAAVKDDLFDFITETAQELGHTLTDDFERDGPQGFGITDTTTHGGRRGSTARRYLRPALNRKNLTLVCNAQTRKVLLDGRRAVGVEYVHEGKVYRVKASREVILSAGAYHSPKLLMLSGIGPADHLREMNIPVIRELRGVGNNLQDHYGYSIVYHTHELMSVDRQMRMDRLAGSVLRWGLTGGGPVSGLPLSAIGYLKTREGMERPDIELLFTPASLDAQMWFPGWRPANGQQLAISVSLLRPQTKGHVKLGSDDPEAVPRITHNYLADPEDRAAFLRAAHMVRSFMETEPIASVVSEEVFPGAAANDDEALAGFIRETMRSMMHACGTCAMGTGEDSVVDPELRVNGIDGLRVVDASVMPSIPTGHTNAPTIMLAEKAAALILGRTEKRGDSDAQAKVNQ
ncbi:glucose-methanol-choline oxidoreductase [Parasphingopyxis algicola]|uniref:GMC family oxidoreductase n=1 Tax=Parasphingopyxis algicola TaxID=2026624 RepID=UPI0015A0E1A9|nr:GMC family oxidoreductase N-terminal domain-containing protein [Parasphingopyxis algicola]QLC24860.1 glucose-methanol-choline oxidoreductase [Parasphingopyxis algicola]